MSWNKGRSYNMADRQLGTYVTGEGGIERFQWHKETR